jgi:hypothetical protein
MRKNFPDKDISATPISPAPPLTGDSPGPVNGKSHPFPPIVMTRFTNSTGPLTKRIELAADGCSTVSDNSACSMYRGEAERVEVRSVNDLADLIGSTTTEQALALGHFDASLPQPIRIVTAENVGSTKRPHIARVNANFKYDGPAFALLDFDSKGITPQVRAKIEACGGVWQALVSVLPELATVARVTRSSTSSGLFRSDTGAPIPGSDGQHNFIMVKDGNDLVRFLDTLHDRLWLAGFGWFWCGKTALHQRSPTDRLVGTPERLVFEGAPQLVPPLVQDAEVRRPRAYDGDMLDTMAACPPLSIVEQIKVNELKAAEHARMLPQERAARKAFVATQKKGIAKARGISEEAAEKVVAKMLRGELTPDVVLEFDDPAFAGATVGDVLADPAKYTGRTLADPVEGVEYGRCKAKVMLRDDGSPFIHSFAHGKTIYSLLHYYASIGKLIEAATQFTALGVLTGHAVKASLDPVEEELLKRQTMKKAKIGAKPVNVAMKDAKAKQTATDAAARKAAIAAKRTDPRPRVKVPSEDDPWLPQMKIIDDVVGADVSARPPPRDLTGNIVRVTKTVVPNTHAFADSNRGDDDDDATADA